MADDFNVSIGFDTKSINQAKKEFENLGVGGGKEPAKAERSMASGVAGGLKIAGVVGLLSSISIVTSSLGIILELIGVAVVSLVGFLGALLGLFITKVVSFFEDPTRSLLKFGLFLINGIISGLEFGLNMVVTAVNLVVSALNFLIPKRYEVSPMEKFELPRFQEDLVLTAYDDFRDNINELVAVGKDTPKELLKAGIGFSKAFMDSFITNTEYQKLVEEQATISNEKSIDALNSTEVLADILTVGANSSAMSFGDGFGALGKLAQLMIKRSNEIIGDLGGREFKQSAENLKIGDTFKQSTTFTQKQARVGLYILGK